MTENAPHQASSGSEVFVSYASEDVVIANTIVAALEQQGFRCWIAPRDVIPGSHYADGIVRAINGSKLLVLVLSEYAIASPHVGKEIERASSKRHPIIAVRTDAAPLTHEFEYFLSESQWIDAGAEGTDAVAVKVVEAVGHHVDPSAAAEPRSLSVKPIARRTTTLRRTKWLVVGGVAMASLALAYFVGDKFWLSKRVATGQPAAAIVSTVAPAAASISEKSIAVLPFTDMSETKDQEYLADGMAEEVINLLAQVPDLLVSARTSSFSFKRRPTKIPEIAHELGVAHILEGSIRRSADHLRVTAKLVRADNGYHLWSETYDRELRDIFKVQDEIANAVVQALQIKLTAGTYVLGHGDGGELSRRKGGTQNLEAYQFFLRAMSSHNQGTPSSLDAANEYFNEAIKLDPRFGMAWLGLANVAGLKVNNLTLAAAEGYERSRQLAQHALELSPDLVDARARLAVVHIYFDWDWAAAENELRGALAIDPTNPTVHFNAGFLSYVLGRWEDAERQFQFALLRDPINTAVLFSLGGLYYKTGRFAEAEALYQKLLELAPGFVSARARFGHTLLADGKPVAALAMAQQSVRDGTSLYGAGGPQLFLPIALQENGREAEADALLNAEIPRWTERGAYYVAMNYAYRGDHDLALQWLERAYQQKDPALVLIVGEPLFRSMADDPRYKAFLRKMNLPE